MKGPLRFLLLIATFTVAASAGLAQPNQRALETQADIAFEQKNFAAAVGMYAQLIQRAPKVPKFHLQKARAHYNLREFDKALAELEEGVRLGGRVADLDRLKAFIYLQQGDFPNGFANAQKVLAVTPNDPALLELVAESYILQKKYAEALDAAKKLQILTPNAANVHYLLAATYYGQGESQKQRVEADAALTAGTAHPAEAHFIRGDACQKLRDMECAIEAYSNAISLKRDMFPAYKNLAEVYRVENRIGDAIALLSRAKPIFGLSADLYIELSHFYNLADDPVKAAETASAAIQIDRNRSLGHTYLCRANNDLKKYELAISNCNAALALNAGDGETNFYLGRAYNLLGRTAEAAKYYAQAVKGMVEFTTKNPEYSEGWYLLGNAYFADGQREKAIAAYQKCLEKAPKTPRALFNLGVLYRAAKNRPAALEQYNKLRAIDAKSADELKAEIDKP